MSKLIKITLVLLLILFGISQGFKLINKIDDSIFSYTVKDESTDKYESTDKDNKSSLSKKDTESVRDKSDNSDSNNHTIAISSPLYNAIVSLDENSKEININPISTEDINNVSYDNYINFDDEEIKYLLENSSTLMQEFKSNNLFEKYDMVSKMLREYDTDINESDIINLAFSYLK